MARWALESFERGAKNPNDGQGPYQIQHELQQKMQDLVGIVRTEEDMKRALAEIESFKQRSGKVCVHGNREYNTGWHTALDLSNLLTISEAITRAAIERKESRGGHFREDYQAKDKTFGELNIVVRRGPGG